MSQHQQGQPQRQHPFSSSEHGDEKVYPLPKGEEEGGGLSRGSQVGIAAFFVGLPFLAMVAEALALGETGLIVSALGAGAISLTARHLINKHHERANAHLNLLPEPYRALVERWHTADWGALVRPLEAGEAREQQQDEGEEGDQGDSVPTFGRPSLSSRQEPQQPGEGGEDEDEDETVIFQAAQETRHVPACSTYHAGAGPAAHPTQ